MTIVSVLPDLLGTYGDTGNALVLLQRLRWRGIAVELVEADARSRVPVGGDIYLLGGGQDAQQYAATQQLRADQALHRAVARGATVFAVCAGLQILGREFHGSDGVTHPGLDILDLTTRRLPRRAVGEIVVDCHLPGVGLVTGYENHAYGTVLGASLRPLGGVLHGCGNGWGTFDGVEGESVFGTYAHGPVLARNPALADFLITRATGLELSPLQLPEVDLLRSERLRATHARRALSRLLRRRSPGGGP